MSDSPVALYLHHTCMYHIYRSIKWYFIKGVGTGTVKGGGVALALYTFFFLLLRFVISPASTSLQTPLFTTIQNWPHNGLISIGETRDLFYINFIFCSTVSSCTYKHISHIYLLNCSSIYIYVSVLNLHLDFKYIDIA